MDMQIYFPHLGILLEHVGKNISIFGFSIAYYGLVIMCGMLLALLLITYLAKKQGENPDPYYDVTLLAIFIGVIGARVYYVFFSWEDYKDHPLEVFNIRNGGLAIYGGIIFGLLTIFIFTRIKKRSYRHMMDILIIGVVLGQCIGRWGNFFNREAFGEYTDGLLAMQLPVTAVRSNEITDLMWQNATVINDIKFIQVSPTFLYESLWNLLLFILLIFLLKRKRFEGQVFYTYLLGYGIGRFWIEALRTDQLLISGSQIPVSRALSAAVVVLAIILLAVGFAHADKEGRIVEDKKG